MTRCSQNFSQRLDGNFSVSLQGENTYLQAVAYLKLKYER